uniref:Uncharacterized protein n=1 Tax=Arundo donax TaxID=35708 RepID=A0A0A8Z596_ARUDO
MSFHGVLRRASSLFGECVKAIGNWKLSTPIFL